MTDIVREYRKNLILSKDDVLYPVEPCIMPAGVILLAFTAGYSAFDLSCVEEEKVSEEKEEKVSGTVFCEWSSTDERYSAEKRFLTPFLP